MIISFQHLSISYKADLSKPIDISMPLTTDKDAASAWYVEPIKIEPVKMGDWVGDVKLGSSVNFRNIFFNPHGNGTHTECVGHISKENYSINKCLQKFCFVAQLITVEPIKENEDYIIKKEQFTISDQQPEALIIRTLPNSTNKLNKQYSNTNPAYLHHEAAKKIVDFGIDHLLIDLPSVDKEKDQGKLLAHHSFWQYPVATRKNATITELIYVPSSIPDGLYLLNIQIASFENDASPSKPVLYKLKKA